LPYAIPVGRRIDLAKLKTSKVPDSEHRHQTTDRFLTTNAGIMLIALKLKMAAIRSRVMETADRAGEKCQPLDLLAQHLREP